MRRARNGRFHDASIVVTGSSRGIGEAIAEMFANEGASVLGIARSAGRNVSGERIVPLSADLSDATGRREASSAIAALDRVDVMVHAAGVFPRADTVAAHGAMALNVAAPAELTRAALPMLGRCRGNVVMISSLNAVRPRPEALAYSAAKAALEAVTRALAIEAAEHGVRVNAVAPGPVPTDLLADAIGGADPSYMIAHIPLGRLGNRQDIAAAVCFLASSEASWITGQVLRVDGGLSVA